MAPFVHRLQEDTMPSTSSTSGSVLYHAPHVNVARIAVLVFLGLPILLVLGIGLLLLVGHSKNPALLVLTTPPSLLAIAAAVVLTRLRFTVSTSGLTIVNFLVTRRIATSNAQPRPPRWVRRRRETQKRLRAEGAMSAQRSAPGDQAPAPTATRTTDRRKR